MTPDEFMATAAKPSGVSGSTPWAAAYAADIRRVWVEDAAVDPRTLQTALGPSELGVACDRQVAGKMAGVPRTNHVADPWPSIRGRALHAHAERVFARDNATAGARWLTEHRVAGHPDHPGTADLYDATWQAVVDHKFLGPTSMAKLRSSPPRKYRRQLYLYGLGYLDAGLPVRRVVLLGYPATAASLDGLYAVEWPFTADGSFGTMVAAAAAELLDVFDETARRRSFADDLVGGRCSLMDVPARPDPDECFFCPFYRPQAARDRGAGCPGTASAPSL